MPLPSDSPEKPRRSISNILRQAWPVLISQWAGMAYGVIDTTMTGHASAVDLAAMALSVSIYITVFVGLMGVVHALIPILAHLYGANKPDEIGRMWGQGIWLALGLSAVGAVILLQPHLWLSLSGDVSEPVRERVSAYLASLAIALPAALVFRCFYALGTAVSRVKPVMVINVLSIPLKALFNWLLIFGRGGLPALGAVGAGISTALVCWLCLAAGLWVALRGTSLGQFPLRLGRPHWASLKELLRLGLPMGASYLVEACAFTFMALLVARNGTDVTASHQILANLAAVCYMIPMSFGVAAGAQAAQALGAGRPRSALQIGHAGLLLGLGIAVATSIVIVLARPWLLSLYTDSAAVSAITASLWLILPVFHLFDSMQCMHSYLLRAYKVTARPLVIQTLALLLIGLGGGWWLGFGASPHIAQAAPWLSWLPKGAPIGAAALWAMAAVGLACSALLLHGLYRRVATRALQAT